MNDIPIYVTRRDNDGNVGVFSLSPTRTVQVGVYLAIFAFVLVLLNVIGWGIYGLVHLIGSVA